ncbi:chemotaxis protein CheW [Frateuria aurantia]|uniref:Chemotaxis signal transduction protein n=1 Tax=Frateuria aurantia (strain ATCC 33424 / DSM 6220 / KCTC 2777 / LMG 1558 / NBRC 3245 / NCIMB 13370) TaxID=767434 RepID=H8L3G3_FRAAD|nr:chemotaxis protein CheW [Frateuria aurantia]AFC86485.1 chemotaxis signal transduction protein [Frateuria aurantia DSM 6220]
MATLPGDAGWLDVILGEQHYALPLQQVQEVIREADITPVPGAARAIIGVIHLRGDIITIIDMRERLGLPPHPDGPKGPSSRRLVIVHDGTDLVGVRVDDVGAVLNLEADARQPLPEGRPQRDSDPVMAAVPAADGFIALIDPQRLCQITVTETSKP